MSRRAPIPLSAAVLKRLELVFAPEERREASRMLLYECGVNVQDLGQDPSAYDRLRLAAMKASLGRIEGLRRAVVVAQTDWRDLYVEAGFAEDPHAHTRWLVPGSAEAAAAARSWEPRDPLAGSRLPQVPGIVIASARRHVPLLEFTVHGVPAHEFVHGLLTALSEGEEVMLPDPSDDCGRSVRSAAGAWQTRIVCHGRFGDPWHDATRPQAFAWLLPAAEPMVGDSRISGTICLPPLP